MLNLTATKPQLKVVFDQVGTPTYALDLANAIVVAIEDYKKESLTLNNEPYTKNGIYHFSNEGVCSWYDFACAIRDLSGNFCDIRPCHSDEFPSKTRRPHFSVLDKTLVKKTFGITIPHWYSSLKDCISRL
jgi:dTDP-4-dehydrorhamnose reductase